MTIHRIEVRVRSGLADPRADRLMARARDAGIALAGARAAKVYLLEGDLDEASVDRIRDSLLTDPVAETSNPGAVEASGVVIEIHPRPGVMDPAAQSVEDAVRSLTGEVVRVQTGERYDLVGIDAANAMRLAERALANPVVQAIHDAPFLPLALPSGSPAPFSLGHVPMRDLDDAGLERLSRDGHLFLDLAEMRAIRDAYRDMGREPTDIELETLAQTWSEHCVHKTLKSTIRYRDDGGQGASRIEWAGRPGVEVHQDGSVTIHNLLRSTVAAATHELIAEGLDWTLSVFVDNAGIIAFDDQHAVCVKVETHNHPSAIEPYGGAATGIGGCIRDIMGAGLAARPIAATDVFCVAPPTTADDEVPAGCIHPRRTLREIVAGVRDYGNRMGIPIVNGAVIFDERYIGNPLVYCGCVGVMPRDKVAGAPSPGDRIIAMGGRTGRDGIHGATFSSAELTDSHADEFAHAVQIGNAIEQKRVLDAIMRARDHAQGCLFSAITDCGAGGFSSAIGEMGESLGADVTLETAPLKYDGLTYSEIWISEAQERMVLAVPPENIESLATICAEEGVEWADLGRLGTTDRELVLNYQGHEVGRMSMAFLHDGIPTPTREARWSAKARSASRSAVPAPSIQDALPALLADPDIASKHWIIRQYDHEVQGATVIKPLVGPRMRGPSDASVIEPVAGSARGLAIACGVGRAGHDDGVDPYQMALCAIDECVRNLVCVGADPSRIAILDNFCWPSCRKEENLGALVRACIGCYDGAKAYCTPFVSGKDSLNNQFTTEDGRTIEIPFTLLISGIGIIENIGSCITSDAKRPGSMLGLLAPEARPMGGSAYGRLFALEEGENNPGVDPILGPASARAMATMIGAGHVLSAHDVSDGGLGVAIAEMLIGGNSPQSPIGAQIHLPDEVSAHRALFAEPASSYLFEVAGDAGAMRQCEKVASASGLHLRWIGKLTDSATLDMQVGTERASWDVETLANAWLKPLDW